MNLKALHEISGVKVVSGKGKGSDTAHPGDIFTSDSAERLIAEGSAVEAGKAVASTDASHRGPDVTEGIGSVAEPAPAPAPVEPAKPAAKTAAKGKSKKAAEPAPASVDDLGLGDDNGEEEVVE